MARITRNKAAEILGLSRQTISNYIEQGLIGSCVGEHGILYVNSEDVEKYAQKYKMIAANEKMIDDKLKEIEAHKRAINVELTELRNRATATANWLQTLLVCFLALSMRCRTLVSLQNSAIVNLRC